MTARLLAPLLLLPILLACAPAPSASSPASEAVVPPARSAPAASATQTAKPGFSMAPSKAQGKPVPSGAEQREAAMLAFMEGRKAMSQGDYVAACQLFAESLQLDHAVGTLLNLADCTERLGDRAGACRHFIEAADAERARGGGPRERFAIERARALGCLLPRPRTSFSTASALPDSVASSSSIEPLLEGLDACIEPRAFLLWSSKQRRTAWFGLKP